MYDYNVDDTAIVLCHMNGNEYYELKKATGMLYPRMPTILDFDFKDKDKETILKFGLSLNSCFDPNRWASLSVWGWCWGCW